MRISVPLRAVLSSSLLRIWLWVSIASTCPASWTRATVSAEAVSLALCVAVLALVRLRQLVQECVWELRLFILSKSVGLLSLRVPSLLSLFPQLCSSCSLMGPVSLLDRLSLWPASCHFFPSTLGSVVFSDVLCTSVPSSGFGRGLSMSSGQVFLSRLPTGCAPYSPVEHLRSSLIFL